MSEQAIAEKRCTKCGNVYPATLEYFHRNKPYKYGLHPYCKGCVSNFNTGYYRRPERQERVKVWAKAYYQRPEIRERDLTWRKAHGYSYRYRHPEVYERMLTRTRLSDQRRRARKLAVAGISTAAQIQDLLKRQKHKCYYCHARLKKSKGKYIYHIDHTFPISRVAGSDIPANDISYLVLACPTCNMSKGDKFPWEFFEGGRLM